MKRRNWLPFLGLVLCLVTRASAQEARDGREPVGPSRELANCLARLAAAGGGPLLRESPAADQAPRDVVEWLHNNADAILHGHRGPFTEALPWGVCTSHENRLFLLLLKFPANNSLSIPRLHNSVRTLKVNGKPVPMNLRPGVEDWEVTLPAGTQYALLPVVELELDGPPRATAAAPPQVRPADDGSIQIHARDAVTHGKMLRFEPQPHKDTVGYWTRADDWAEWRFAIVDAGTYTVTLRYGCGDGQGGSEVAIQIGPAALPFTVEATGGFQAWRDASLGNVELPAGEDLKLTIKPRRKARDAVMDVQQITLRKR